MRFVLPLVAAILPVVIAPGLLFYFDVTPKLLFLLIGAAVALVLWRGDLPMGSRRNRVFLWLLLLEGASLAISTALSTHPALSLNGGNWRRFGLVTQLAVLIFATLVAADCASGSERVRTYLKAIVVGGIPVGIYAVMQYFGWDPWLPKGSYHVGDIVRPPSTLGHADYLGTYLVFVVFACVGLFRGNQTPARNHADDMSSSPGRPIDNRPQVSNLPHIGRTRAANCWQWVAGVTAALACAAIVMSGTRAALLGLVGGAVVILVLRGPGRPIDNRPQVSNLPHIKWWAIGTAAVVGLGCVFYFSPAGKAIRNRVHWIAEEPLGGARPLLWRDSLAMSVNHLAFGYGPETFITEFPRHESVDLARAFPEFLHESPHNIFLDALISQGIPGLLVLAGLCVWGVFAARKSPALGAALAGGITAQLFTSFVLPTAVFFFLTLALLVQPGPTRRIPVLRLAACFGAVILAVYAVRFIVADHALAGASASLDRGDLQNSISEYGRSVQWALPGSSADLYYSRRLADFVHKTSDFRIKAQALRAAYTAALNATHTSEERSNAWYNLAGFLATTDSPADVERSLRESIAAAPNWYKPHWVLAQLYLVQKRLDDAQREAEIAVQCNGKAPEVLNTLENIRTAQRH
jgi:O-antigen ligase